MLKKIDETDSSTETFAARRFVEKDGLNSSVQYVKGIGPQRAKLLDRLNIKTARDALYYLPYRYEDRRNIKKIHGLSYGLTETAVGKILVMDVIKLPRTNFKIFELVISDGTGLLKGKWFNQPFMKRYFKVGQEVILSGLVKQDPYWRAGLVIENPEYEFVAEDADNLIHTSRIVPVYNTTAGMSVRVLRNTIFNILNASMYLVKDPVPEEILTKYKFKELKECIRNCHFPEADADMDALNNGRNPCRQRLSFDELFNLELGIAIMKKNETRAPGISFNPKGSLTVGLLTTLPFGLTAAQQRVFNEILHDMQQPYAMNRLVQGDVGCGKTIIALMAMLTAVECGYQAALMAPTELLAGQHYINIHKLAEGLGLSICLLTGSSKERPMDEIASGKMNIVVGTHALIQEGVSFGRLGLAVIDEQHRFGVMQRAILRKKSKNPDVLVMTATPIPRTLALTLYGDLDHSVIDELPPNRSPVITRLFREGQKQRIYRLLSEEIKKGRQVYVVYPVIEESEKTDLKSAINGKLAFERMFPDFRIGLVHGKMNTALREAVMTSFKNREIDLLVSTTVIEVGVDVPNATMMLIVHAERFGLSQLHQLRGRVGRGGEQSYCLLLVYEPCSEEAGKRLDIMVKSSDGFRIAEEDLIIRGPGEFLGTKQSGIPDLRIADIVRDSGLLDIARNEAFRIISEDPGLEKMPELKRSVEALWEGKMEIFKTA